MCEARWLLLLWNFVPADNPLFNLSQLIEEELAEVWIQEALITELRHRAETGMPTKVWRDGMEIVINVRKPIGRIVHH